jgi:2-methylcitrate dehydratase PrpD
MKMPISLVAVVVLVVPSFASAQGTKKESKNLTQRVAHEIVEFDYAGLPPEVIAKTETLIRDSLACAVGAHSSEALLAYEEIIGPNGGDCLIFHSGKKGKLLEAVALNSQAANMLDFDDAHTNLGHPGATIVPVALTIAQKYGKSREEVIEAVAAAYEFNLRWARAVFDYEGKMAGPWSIALLQSYGAYVTAAKLLDLDETQVARGLYFAAAGMPLPVAQKTGLNPGQTMNGMKNYYGQASHSMVQAALLAKAGIYSDTEVLDGDQGLWRMMGAKEFHEERVLANLGKDWLIHEMQLKPYSACRWNHAAIDALGELAPQFKPSDLKQIDIHTFQSAVNACSKTDPASTFEVSFSLPHCFGMLLEGHSLILLSEKSVKDEAVLALSRKVKVHLDEKMEALFAKGKLPARVVVTLKDGKTLEKEVLDMKGERGNPIPDEEHAAKVRALIDSSPHENVRGYARKFTDAAGTTSVPSATSSAPKMRYFLFTAQPSSDAWQFMKNNPGDRKADTEKAMKKIGCEMLGYYWGLTHGRNYIIVAAPDGETVQALLVQRLSSDLVQDYEAVELVRSSDMQAMFERLKEIEAADHSIPK